MVTEPLGLDHRADEDRSATPPGRLADQGAGRDASPYTADENGVFDRAEPDEEMHASSTSAPTSTVARMYEVMEAGRPLLCRTSPPTCGTRDFDAGEVRRLKATRELALGGPALASPAIGTGLVDELHLFVTPVVVGGGTRSLPDGVRLELEPLDQRRFGNGVVYLRYHSTS